MLPRNSPEIIRLLVEKHIKLAAHMTRKICRRNKRLYYSDVYSEALLGLYTAACYYDEAKGRFSSFACTVIANTCWNNIVRPQSAKKRDMLEWGWDVDVVANHPDSNPHDVVEHKQLLACIQQRLGTKRFDIFCRLAAGESSTDIGHDYNVSRARISKITIEARNKVQYLLAS